MTKAGEKLYGDWERRTREGAAAVLSRRLLKNLVMFVANVAVAGSALFDFG